MTKGFMDGYSADLPLPHGWRKGQTSIDMPVLCCPECGSIQVCRRDNGAGVAYAWWEYKACAHRYRLPAGIGLKAYING